MKVYAHRANLLGPGTGENRPDAIHRCLTRGINVEVDVWGVGREMWLGHDRPEWRVEQDLLENPSIMCHAKNVEAVQILRKRQGNFFCLERDMFSLCSNGLIWTNYGGPSTPLSIVCSPELVGAAESLERFVARLSNAYGICTDYPLDCLDLQKDLQA